MVRNALCISILLVAMALPTGAYERHLASNAIRDAYFLGSAKDNRTSSFLSAYTHSLPRPKSGPHVSTISIETPYAQVIRRSGRLNYSAQDATQDFFGKVPLVRIRIEINLTPTYVVFPGASIGSPVAITDDFWRAFKFQLIQNGAEVPAQSRHAEPLYFGSSIDGSASVSGTMIELQYAAGKVASEKTVVKVLTPDGQDVETKFDLAALR